MDARMLRFIEDFFAATFRFDRQARPGANRRPWTEGLEREDRERVRWFLRDDLGLDERRAGLLDDDLDSPERLAARLEEMGVPPPAGAWPPPVNVAAFLDRGAARGRDRVFLLDGPRTWTWGDFDDQARAVAARLGALGLEPGGRVVLHLGNSGHYAAWFFGTLLAGGTVVPLHPALRNTEVRAALAGSGARILVDEVAETAAALSGEVRLFWAGAPEENRGWEPARELAPQPPAAPAEPGEPAMILYTSGTTGEPKGVCLPHRALYENTVAILSYLGLTPQDRALAALPWCFAYGNSVLLTHVLAGGSLVVEPNQLYPTAIRQSLETHAITGVPGVPPFFATLLSRGALRREALPALRYITVAGGALPVPQLEKLRTILPGVEPWVMYGQTEACARLTYVPPRELDDHIGSAGRPIAGMEIRIMTPEGELAGPGEWGEVVARGTSLMSGYYGDARATAEALRGGWLRTGDLGYLREDGYLYIVDRIKAMLKVDGFRISPLEVERVVSRLDWVEEVLVTAEGGDDGKAVLAALVVPRPGGVPDERALQRHCAAELAHFKVPRVVRFVESLPRTVGGKLRRAGQSGR